MPSTTDSHLGRRTRADGPRRIKRGEVNPQLPASTVVTPLQGRRGEGGIPRDGRHRNGCVPIDEAGSPPPNRRRPPLATCLVELPDGHHRPWRTPTSGWPAGREPVPSM